MTEMSPLVTAPERVKLRVEDYRRLDEAGAFKAYGKTELLDGDIVYMNAQYRPHARIKSRLHVRISQALSRIGSSFEALVESSVAMPPNNVPEPDIALTAEPEGDGLIPLASLAIVVEVADSTLENDLGRKQAIYAEAAVPEYWVVDVQGEVIHQLWQPAGTAYTEGRQITFGDPITSMAIPGLTVATDRL
ncbi:Uma2 family endonuclease [Sphingomonadaceae bacterium OTU29MARTA1]|nr:Uma2 family endonuclease [Sphingomonadaceae bacterium OTU29LAMAA1]USU09241.1 Uma2 family endonuclease [Sphingomonadaceae bacterium OTU29MARTA1]